MGCGCSRETEADRARRAISHGVILPGAKPVRHRVASPTITTAEQQPRPSTATAFDAANRHGDDDDEDEEAVPFEVPELTDLRSEISRASSTAPDSRRGTPRREASDSMFAVPSLREPSVSSFEQQRQHVQPPPPNFQSDSLHLGTTGSAAPSRAASRTDNPLAPSPVNSSTRISRLFGAGSVTPRSGCHSPVRGSLTPKTSVFGV